MTPAERRDRPGARWRRGPRLPALPGLRAWLWGAAVALVAVAAAGAGAKAVQQGRILPLERVAVTELPERISDERIREALAPHLHRSLLAVDMRGARQALEALPWVASAEVRRAWPGALEVALVERQPLARWAGGGLLDTDGQRFEPPAGTVPEGLARLAGPAGSEREVAELFKDLRQRLAEQGVEVAALRLSPRASWRAELAGGVEVALGRQQPRERAARFAAVLPTLRQAKQAPLERVDLRYPNGFAVAWGAAEEAD